CHVNRRETMIETEIKGKRRRIEIGILMSGFLLAGVAGIAYARSTCHASNCVTERVCYIAPNDVTECQDTLSCDETCVPDTDGGGTGGNGGSGGGSGGAGGSGGTGGADGGVFGPPTCDDVVDAEYQRC